VAKSGRAAGSGVAVRKIPDWEEVKVTPFGKISRIAVAFPCPITEVEAVTLGDGSKFGVPVEGSPPFVTV
jgi:hypothetical protein